MNQGQQRPLIPVNPQGLEEIATALLVAPSTDSPVNTASGNLPEIVIKNPQGYIFVPEKKVVIATRQSYNQLKWSEAIRAAQTDHLKMPPIDVFMQHFLNLRDAAEGKKRLFYADGKLISKNQAIEHWNYVSSTDRGPFGDQPFWIWLDADFKSTASGMHIETAHRYQGNKLEAQIVKLDAYMNSNGWVDLSLNKHGLPKNSSTSTNYVQGKNIYFWQPIADRVAGFVASSSWASLDCFGDRQGSSAVLGVLPCAEGTQKT